MTTRDDRRDTFAAAALAGGLGQGWQLGDRDIGEPPKWVESSSDVAKRAFAIADAMLAESDRRAR